MILPGLAMGQFNLTSESGISGWDERSSSSFNEVSWDTTHSPGGVGHFEFRSSLSVRSMMELPCTTPMRSELNRQILIALSSRAVTLLLHLHLLHLQYIL